MQTVAVVAILAGDAVGKLMEVGLTGNNSPGVAQARRNPGVCRCDLLMRRIKVRAAACRKSCKVETILERDRQTKEGQRIVARGCTFHLAERFGEGPAGIERKISVSAGIAVGARQRGSKLSCGIGFF